ncbi:MAG: hypothetical protein ACFN23_01385, partial [Capnocytophaga gingivalis]
QCADQAADGQPLDGQRGECLFIAPQAQAVAHSLYALPLFECGCKITILFLKNQLYIIFFF